MPTLNQLFSPKTCRIPKRKVIKKPMLVNRPQRKGICIKVYTRAPKKPNSALRKLVKVKIAKSRAVIAHIPGETHNLHQYSMVLIRGGRVKDLPGVKYRIVRGKLDLLGLPNRRAARSKYGAKRPRM